MHCVQCREGMALIFELVLGKCALFLASIPWCCTMPLSKDRTYFVRLYKMKSTSKRDTFTANKVGIFCTKDLKVNYSTHPKRQRFESVHMKKTMRARLFLVFVQYATKHGVQCGWSLHRFCLKYMK